MSILDSLALYEEKDKYKALKLLLDQKARKEKRLYSALLEITPICSLNCPMCYVRLEKDEVVKHGEILSGEYWKHIIESIAQMGAMSITLSGGECTMHPDFIEIYRYAYQKGLKITVLTNGTAITDDILDLFSEYPPSVISMTLYGFSKETYDRVCKNGRAFERVIQAIKAIKERQIRLEIKCTFTKSMLSDFPAIYDFVKQNDLVFNYSIWLQNLRNTSSVVVAQESLDEKDIEFIENIIGRVHAQDPEQVDSRIESQGINEIVEKGMLCGAGNDSCCINWKGEMLPCVSMDAHKAYPLRDGVEVAW